MEQLGWDTLVLQMMTFRNKNGSNDDSDNNTAKTAKTREK
jgi:hypothetical protein